MRIRTIRSETEYDEALAEVARLMEIDLPEGSEDDDRLDTLATLIEVYEAQAHPIATPHPIEAIEVRMAEKGITRRQLCAVAHISESKLSEMLARKRALSVTMMRSLGPILDLPLGLLVQPYPVTIPLPTEA